MWVRTWVVRSRFLPGPTLPPHDRVLTPYPIPILAPSPRTFPFGVTRRWHLRTHTHRTHPPTHRAHRNTTLTQAPRDTHRGHTDTRSPTHCRHTFSWSPLPARNPTEFQHLKGLVWLPRRASTHWSPQILGTIEKDPPLAPLLHVPLPHSPMGAPSWSWLEPLCPGLKPRVCFLPPGLHLSGGHWACPPPVGSREQAARGWGREGLRGAGRGPGRWVRGQTRKLSALVGAVSGASVGTLGARGQCGNLRAIPGGLQGQGSLHCPWGRIPAP